MMQFWRGRKMNQQRHFASDICLAFFMFLWHSAVGLGERELRFHPKYPPVIWFPEFPMFNNRTNPARIVVQMHDSLDFFCPDYIASQYQSFTGAKKIPSDFGAEEIYMVDGQDYGQSCFVGVTKSRLPKKLLLRCPGKSTDVRIKAKYQYTVSFRMFSPVPKGPEFNCNQEYYFLGIFPGHNHDEEAIEKALCSTNALRLQIFVSCSDIPSQHIFDTFSSPNVIQLDRPAQASELRATSPVPTKPPTSPPADPTTFFSVQSVGEVVKQPGKRKTTRPAATGASVAGFYVARSDRKIMRNDADNNHLTPRRITTSRTSEVTRSPDSPDVADEEPRVTASTFKSTGTSKLAGKPSMFYTSSANDNRRTAVLFTPLYFLIAIFPVLLILQT